MLIPIIYDNELQAAKIPKIAWKRFLSFTLLFVVISCVIFRTTIFPIGYRTENSLTGSCCKCDDEDNGLSPWTESKLLDTADHARLFYNRVPKCGSTTMFTLMKKLSAALGFKHFQSKVYDKKRVTEEEQRRIVQWVKTPTKPCSFDRHVFFINFTNYGERPPLYINVIRDPVERIISSFYYRRMVVVNNRTVAPTKTKPSSYWLNKKFERCVLTSDPECTFVDGNNYVELQLPYFCGHDPECLSFNNPRALQRAKQNIVSNYAVVGVLQHMNVTLEVLEALLPTFFTGVSKIYHGLRMNKNFQKKYVSEQAKQLLKSNLTGEYELYNFVVQRLFYQHHKLSSQKKKRRK